MKKSQFTDCGNCELKNQPIVIGETNCKNNLENVDLLILAEAPALEEIKNDKPLVGKSGKIFRQVFEELELNKLNYYITNVVLCSNIDENNKTHNPNIDTIKRCRNNLDELLKVINPKLIFTMGNIPLFSMGITDNIGGIMKLRGTVSKFKNINTLHTVHPSFVVRNGGINSEEGTKFKNDFQKIFELLHNDTKIPEVKINKQKDEIFSIKIPDKYYTEEYTLHDVQHAKPIGKIVYSFKDKNGNKNYYTEDDRKNNYYYEKLGRIGDCKHFEDYKNLNLVHNRYYYKNIKPNVCPYEGDVALDIRHSVDYRFNRNTEEPIVPLKIQYMDIELFNDFSKAFPDMDKANRPINSISFKTGEEKVKLFLLHYPEFFDKKNIKNRTDIDLRVFDNEKELLKEYFKETRESKPDVITAWNGEGFDIPYIYNRCKVLDLDFNLYSPLKCTDINLKGKYTNIEIYGTAFVDMMFLFKKFSRNERESYKLDYICKTELGEGKVAYEGTLDTLYRDDINTFIEYSYIDTLRLYELEEKLKYIELLSEMIKICSATWRSSSSTTGLVDPVILQFAKENGLVCKNSNRNAITRKYKGGFVRIPNSGIHEWIVDFDYTSLYPSIIISCNIDPDTYICKIDSDQAHKYIYTKDSFLKENPSMEVLFYPSKESSKPKKIKAKEFDKFILKNRGIVTINGCVFYGHDKCKSFVSRIIENIWESRKFYKKERDKYHNYKEKYNVCDARQWAYKILMNSIYGAMGNKYFRIFNVNIAEAITLTGQEISIFAQYHLSQYMDNKNKEINPNFISEHENKELPYIIYGDTDSLFVNMSDYLYHQG